jgi:hypothetical protein
LATISHNRRKNQRRWSESRKKLAGGRTVAHSILAQRKEIDSGDYFSLYDFIFERKTQQQELFDAAMRRNQEREKREKMAFFSKGSTGTECRKCNFASRHPRCDTGRIQTG